MAELELILGCMYAGKTEELMRRVRLQEIAGARVAVFKPSIDIRYSKTKVSSHNRVELEAIPVSSAAAIIKHLSRKRVDVGAIDEIQFIDDEILDFLKYEIFNKKIKTKYIASGLPRNFRGEPFNFMNSETHIGALMPYAHRIDVLAAVCTYREHRKKVCGESAYETQRLLASGQPAPYDDPLIVVIRRRLSAR